MSISHLKAQLLQELQLVPEEQLSELYNLVHSFRLRLNSASTEPQKMMEFAGCWNDLSPETYADFLDDLSQRRQQAFSQRQSREASFD